MIGATLIILASLAARTDGLAKRHGIEIGDRLIAAIQGKAEFQDSDYRKKLSEDDRNTLRRLAICKAKDVHYGLLQHPTKPTVFVRNFNHVIMDFGCRGVPSDQPVTIILRLSDGKVERFELHNTHLMKPQ